MLKVTKFAAVAAVAFAFAFALSAVAASWNFGSMSLKYHTTDHADTMTLQAALNAVNGAGLTPDGVFGKGTKAAVMAFQAAHGLTADGIAGMKTFAALNAAGSSSTTTTTTTTSTNTTTSSGCSAGQMYNPSTGQLCSTTSTGMSGNGSGVLTNVNAVSGYSGLTLNAGEQNDKVLGAQFTATGGDMKIDRVTVDFQRTSGTGYYQLSQYISGVSVWNGSTLLATVPVSAASDLTTTSPDTFEFNIAGLNYVVPNGTTGQLYVSVNVNPTIDNSYASGNSWTVKIPANGLRAIDGSGYTDSYPGSGNLSTSTFSVVNLSSSGNVQLRVSVDPSNPLAYGQQVNSGTGNTANVKLLAISVYAKPGSNVMIRKFPVSFDATTASALGHVADILNNVTLTNSSGQSYTANIPTACAASNATGATGFNGCTVDFGVDSGVLGWTVAAGTTQTWTVTASVKPVGGAFAEGDSIVANVDPLYTYGVQLGNGGLAAGSLDAQDAIGNPLNTSPALSGGSQGNSVGFYVNGVTVSGGASSATISQQSNSQTHQNGQFNLSFTVSALNSSIYIPKAATPASPGTAGYVYYTLKNGSTPVGIAALSSAVSSATVVSGDTPTDFYVSAGSSRTFTLTVGLNNNTVAAGAFQSGNFVLSLTGVNNSQTTGSGYADYTLNVTNIYTNPPLSLY